MLVQARESGVQSLRVVRDKCPEIEQLLIERYPQMTLSEKLRMVAQMAETIRQLQLAEIRLRYPRADERVTVSKAVQTYASPRAAVCRAVR